MNPDYYQTVPRKKQKTDLLLDDKYLRQFILDTREHSRNNLNDMLVLYDFLVFKPNIGGGGKNVGFVKKLSQGYEVLLDETKMFFETSDDIDKYIKNITNKRKFILQKGVELLKHNNSPFDIRIEIQKPYSNWIVTGIAGKVAGKDKMVTNRHSGGTGILLDKVFSDINLDRLSEIKALLTFVGLRTSRKLNEKYKGLREVGIDIGINKDFEAYILEINTKPQYGVFRQAGDEKMLNRIVECNKIIFDSIEYIKREL